MLAQSQLIIFEPGSCQPTFYSKANAYGKFIGGKPFKGSKGRTWTWPGSKPHNTRMHRYAGLSSGQKSAWKAVADAMDDDHTGHGPITYSGPIAYMQTNLYLRLQGMSYTDDAPTPPVMVDGTIVSFQTSGGRQAPILIAWT